jgi:hypothetical protein
MQFYRVLDKNFNEKLFNQKTEMNEQIEIIGKRKAKGRYFSNLFWNPLAFSKDVPLIISDTEKKDQLLLQASNIEAEEIFEALAAKYQKSYLDLLSQDLSIEINNLKRKDL